jgi:hypothetical protein
LTKPGPKYNNLLTTENNMKMSKKDKALMVEAYRRYNKFHIGKPMDTAWLGLGSPHEYKSKYFKCVGNPTPRVQNWWTLTPEGVEVLKKMNNWVDNLRS